MLIILVIQIPTASMSCNLIIQMPRPFGQWEYGNEKNAVFYVCLLLSINPVRGVYPVSFFIIFYVIYYGL